MAARGESCSGLMHAGACSTLRLPVAGSFPDDLAELFAAASSSDHFVGYAGTPFDVPAVTPQAT
jgi:hypothetical protein